MILKQYNANFVTYELDPGNYTIEDLQEAVYPLGDHEGTLQIEYDDLNKKQESQTYFNSFWWYFWNVKS